MTNGRRSVLVLVVVFTVLVRCLWWLARAVGRFFFRLLLIWSYGHHTHRRPHR